MRFLTNELKTGAGIYQLLAIGWRGKDFRSVGITKENLKTKGVNIRELLELMWNKDDLRDLEISKEDLEAEGIGPKELIFKGFSI